MRAEIFNNIIYGTKTPSRVEDSVAGTVIGANNWLQTNATPGPLTNSIQTASPAFSNPTTKDYTLTAGSPCLGAANLSVYGLPGREYYLNESTNCQWRIRAAARDIGAFESTTTSGPFGPYDPAPRPFLSIMPSAAKALIYWPLFAQDFRLEQNSQLSGTVWTAVPYSYSTGATAISVKATMNGSNNFFRLRR